MRSFSHIFAVFTLLVGFVAQAVGVLSDDQAGVLLERYLSGVEQNRFVFRSGKGPPDLRALIAARQLDRIRNEVLAPVDYQPEPVAAAVVPTVPARPALATQPTVDAGWGTPSAKPGAAGWGQGGWSGSLSEGLSQVQRWISEIAAAADTCRYGEAKRLADLILEKEPDNSWLAENYVQIEEWAQRSERYFNALTHADKALGVADYEAVATHLKNAIENAAANCGQDVVATSLLDQTMAAAETERVAAIAQARAEGQMRQQAIAQSRVDFEKQKAERKKRNGGLARGLMGLINTAAKVNTLRSGGGMSTGDALTEVLTEQAMTANPEIAQLVGQAQQIGQTAKGGDSSAMLSGLLGGNNQNGDPAAMLSGLLANAKGGQGGDAASMLSGLLSANQGQQNGAMPNLGNFVSGAAQGSNSNFGATTASNGTSNAQMSATCRKLYEELRKLGEQYKQVAQLYAGYQKNPKSVSTAELQSSAARIQQMYDHQKIIIQRIKAERCPGSENIPDM